MFGFVMHDSHFRNHVSETCLCILAFELCFSFRNRVGLINGAMFDIQKWGYVSVAEMGPCIGLINGGMIDIQKWGYVSVAEMGPCIGLIYGGMFDIQKWGYVSVAEMGVCLCLEI